MWKIQLVSGAGIRTRDLLDSLNLFIYSRCVCLCVLTVQFNLTDGAVIQP